MSLLPSPARHSWKVLALACLTLLLPLKADAQTSSCLPGLPCVVNATPNDPDNTGDGPNAGGAPNASKTASAACDADFMNQIYSTAFMNAERQIQINDTLIRKPDSVLEYSCFDQVASATRQVGKFFTESTFWRNRTVPINGLIFIARQGRPGFTIEWPIPSVPFSVFMGTNQIAPSLQNVVLNSLFSYIGSNFSHDLLGAFAQGATGTIQQTIRAENEPYFCDLMNTIHFTAKCMNTFEDTQFFDFDFLAGNDIRQLPAACQGTDLEPGHIDLAANKDFQFVNFDQANEILNLTLSASSCAPAIPTGLMVRQSSSVTDDFGDVTTQHQDFEEKLCITPGCYFDVGSDSCRR